MTETSSKNQICSRCILGREDDLEIVFDLQGVCNHCAMYDLVANERLLRGAQRTEELASLVEAIKASGRDNDYDCVVGASGGVDSTYVAYLAKDFGLRALVVHCDNGWNSELAVKNIENIVKKLDYDLFTYVINWEEFRDLQLSYLKASVVDIEALTDHAITASLFQVAARNRIKYILSGENMVTEGVLPARWVHNKNDLINIKAIHRKFGKLPLKTFPKLGLARKFYYQKVSKIKIVPILNYIDFVKEDAKKIIAEELGWRDYGGKHYESIFTRFYQSYILPVKFGIDKRKSHLSTLICSGQMTREEALEQIKDDPIDADRLFSDKEYIIKKFGLTAESFEALMSLPVKKHTEYASMINIYDRVRPLAKFALQFRRRRLGTAER